jgi:hypothetical protein
MELIRTATELATNIETFRTYVAADSGADRDFALEQVTRDTCFVVTRDRECGFFSPAGFVAVPDNTREGHAGGAGHTEEEIDAALERILGTPPAPDTALEEEYARFCGLVGIPAREVPGDAPRRFSDLR